MADTAGSKPIAVMKVTRIAASREGVYLTGNIPVSYEAFDLIERNLRQKGFNIQSRSGGGADNEPLCTFNFGPFKDLTQASAILTALQEEVQWVYDNEQDQLQNFSHLKREYPIRGGQE